jgi:beta-lactamase class A
MATTRIGALTFLLNINTAFAQEPADNWISKLENQVRKIDEANTGRVGVYIEDLNSGEVFSYHGGKRYYLASIIKIFVMIEVFRLIEKGPLELTDKITISSSKYRDGAGHVNRLKAGNKISIEKLLENMMTLSDNAATDILIDAAGINNIENNMLSLGLLDLGPVTSLLEVRKGIFRQLHPLAGSLTALDYIELWKTKQFNKKLVRFAALIDKPQIKFSREALESAYENFYALGNNSLSLTSLASLYRRLATGKIISAQRSKQMVAIMKRCKTGKDRVKASLPPGWKFANKTGTQHRRACDSGIAFHGDQAKATLAICAERFSSRKAASKQIADIAAAFFRVWKQS